MPPRRHPLPALLTWLPVAACAAWLVELATHLRGMVHDATWNSDVSSPMVLAETLAHAHSTVYLANTAPYSTLLIDLVTRPLPDHRGVWEAWPYALAVLGAVLLGWTVQRVAGWWAGVVAAVLALAVAPNVLFPLITQAVHETTDVNAILLGALLVYLLRGRPPRPAAAAALCAGVGVVTGIDLASDGLLLVAGLIPFAAVVGLVALRGAAVARRRLLVAAGGTVAVALAVSYLTGRVAHHEHIATYSLSLHAAGIGQFRENLRLLGAITVNMGGGNVDQHAAGAAVVALAVCGLIAGLAAWSVVQLLRSGPQVDRRAALLAYWGLLAGLSVLAFLATDIAQGVGTIRYLVPLYFAAGASLALAAAPSPRRRTAAALVATGLVASTTYAMATAPSFRYPLTRDLEPVLALLRQHGLAHGYADYWEANSVTWKTDGAVAPRAVLEGAVCGSTDRGRTCPQLFNSAQEWYRPRAGSSFVLVDPLGGVASPPSEALYGQPAAVYEVGRFSVYVFPYDVATPMASGPRVG